MRHCDSHPSTEQKIMKWNLSFGFEAWESPSTRTLSLTIFSMKNETKGKCLAYGQTGGLQEHSHQNSLIFPVRYAPHSRALRPTCQKGMPSPCMSSLGWMEPWAISNFSAHSPRRFPRTLLQSILSFVYASRNQWVILAEDDFLPPLPDFHLSFEAFLVWER